MPAAGPPATVREMSSPKSLNRRGTGRREKSEMVGEGGEVSQKRITSWLTQLEPG